MTLDKNGEAFVLRRQRKKSFGMSGGDDDEAWLSFNVA